MVSAHGPTSQVQPSALNKPITGPTLIVKLRKEIYSMQPCWKEGKRDPETTLKAMFWVPMESKVSIEVERYA